LPFFTAGVFWLLLSTAVLLGVFIARTPLEQRLAERLGRLFPLLLLLLLATAVGDLVFITLLLMVQFLPAPADAWTTMIGVTAIAAVLVAIIVIATPPSRLERAIATRLDRGHPHYRGYRLAGYTALLGGLVIAACWFRQYYLYERYCVGEPQDCVDCQFLH
jgi:uncharacterized membrane protein YqjE